MSISRRSLQRSSEVAGLADQNFDVLVVGAGIYGVSVARAAALQGWRVALIDRSDFGSGTSANSQKLVHGGLRYLQNLDIPRIRRSISARRRLLAIAPHLVSPLRLVVPTSGLGKTSRWVFRTALGLNDLVGLDRNRGLSPTTEIPRSQTISRAAGLKLIPDLDAKALTGAGTWFDAIADTDRLTIELALDAAYRGAVIANYVEAMDYSLSNGRVLGARARDLQTSEEFEITARVVVNTVGSAPNPVSARDPGDRTDPPGRSGGPSAVGFNLVVKRRLFGDYGVGLPANDPSVDEPSVPGPRNLFFIPWRGCTLVGTMYCAAPTESELEEGANANSVDCPIDERKVQRFLDTINRTYPGNRIEPGEVSFVQWGFLPTASDPRMSGRIELLDHPRIADSPESVGAVGLINVTGVKFTTAIEVADLVVEMASRPLGRDYTPMEREPRLVTAQETPPGGEPIFVGDPMAGLEASAVVRKAVAEEMAVTLADVVLRRADVAARGVPGDGVLSRYAWLVGAEFDWDAARIGREIDSVKRRISCGLAC